MPATPESPLSNTATYTVLLHSPHLLELILLHCDILSLTGTHLYPALVCTHWSAVITASPLLQRALFLRALPARNIASLHAAYCHEKDAWNEGGDGTATWQRGQVMSCVDDSSSEGSNDDDCSEDGTARSRTVILARDAAINPVFWRLFPASAPPLSRFTTRHGYVQAADPARAPRIEDCRVMKCVSDFRALSTAHVSSPSFTSDKDEDASDEVYLQLKRSARSHKAPEPAPITLPRCYPRCPTLWRHMYALQPPAVAMTVATCRGWWGWDFGEITEKAEGKQGVTVGTVVDWLRDNDRKLRKGFVLMSCPPR